MEMFIFIFTANDMYKDENHRLGEIPALLIARLKVEDKKGVRWYSDTVGNSRF